MDERLFKKRGTSKTKVTLTNGVSFLISTKDVDVNVSVRSAHLSGAIVIDIALLQDFIEDIEIVDLSSPDS